MVQIFEISDENKSHLSSLCEQTSGKNVNLATTMCYPSILFWRGGKTKKKSTARDTWSYGSRRFSLAAVDKLIAWPSAFEKEHVTARPSSLIRQTTTVGEFFRIMSSIFNKIFFGWKTTRWSSGLPCWYLSIVHRFIGWQWNQSKQHYLHLLPNMLLPSSPFAKNTFDWHFSRICA